MLAASCPILVPESSRSPTNLSHTPTIWASVPRGRSLAADKVVEHTGGRASGRASNARAAVERRNEGVRAEEGEKEREGEQEWDAGRKKEGEEAIPAVGEEETRAAEAEVNFGWVYAAEGQMGAGGKARLGLNSVQQLGIWTSREYTARTDHTVIVPFLYCR